MKKIFEKVLILLMVFSILFSYTNIGSITVYTAEGEAIITNASVIFRDSNTNEIITEVAPNQKVRMQIQFGVASNIDTDAKDVRIDISKANYYFTNFSPNGNTDGATFIVKTGDRNLTLELHINPDGSQYILAKDVRQGETVTLSLDGYFTESAIPGETVTATIEGGNSATLTVTQNDDGVTISNNKTTSKYEINFRKDDIESMANQFPINYHIGASVNIKEQYQDSQSMERLTIIDDLTFPEGMYIAASSNISNFIGLGNESILNYSDFTPVYSSDNSKIIGIKLNKILQGNDIDKFIQNGESIDFKYSDGLVIEKDGTITNKLQTSIKTTNFEVEGSPSIVNTAINLKDGPEFNENNKRVDSWNGNYININKDWNDNPDGYFIQGDTITFNLTAKNTGDEYGSITINDVIPDGTSLVSATGEGAIINTNQNVYVDSQQKQAVSWTFDNVAPGATVTAKIQLKIDNNADYTFSNKMYLDNDYSSVVASTPEYSVKTKRPEIQVTKTAVSSGGGYSNPGDTITYTIVVENNGSADATIPIVDTLPDSLIYVSSEPDGLYDSTNNTISWNNVNVAMGSSVTYIVVAQVKEGATGSITNKVRADDKETSVTTDVFSPDKLTENTGIYKRTNATYVKKDDIVDYVIEVKNNGPTYSVSSLEEKKLVIIDNLPPELSLQEGAYFTLPDGDTHYTSGITYNYETKELTIEIPSSLFDVFEHEKTIKVYTSAKVVSDKPTDNDRTITNVAKIFNKETSASVTQLKDSDIKLEKYVQEIRDDNDNIIYQTVTNSNTENIDVNVKESYKVTYGVRVYNIGNSDITLGDTDGYFHDLAEQVTADGEQSFDINILDSKGNVIATKRISMDPNYWVNDKKNTHFELDLRQIVVKAHDYITFSYTVVTSEQSFKKATNYIYSNVDRSDAQDLFNSDVIPYMNKQVGFIESDREFQSLTQSDVENIEFMDEQNKAISHIYNKYLVYKVEVDLKEHANGKYTLTDTLPDDLEFVVVPNGALSYIWGNGPIIAYIEESEYTYNLGTYVRFIRQNNLNDRKNPLLTSSVNGNILTVDLDLYSESVAQQKIEIYYLAKFKEGRLEQIEQKVASGEVNIATFINNANIISEETDDNGDPILNDTDSATVSLNKGNIYPGEEKEFLGSFPNGEKNKDDEGNAVITAGSANIGANLVWKITINNGDGDFSTNMVDYKVVDTLPDPYIFDDNYENDTYAGAKYNPSIIVFDENGNIKKSLKGLDFIKPEITDTRVLTWNFNGEEWQLKPNEKLEIIFPSRVENAGEIGAFLNTAKLVTTQVFTRDDVTTGDFVDEKTIESSDFANIYAFMTSSHKEIEYNPTLAGDVDYKQPDYDVGVSEKVDGVLKNTIEGQPNEKVKYTLNVKNESQVRIKDLVIIDRMPYEGDIGVIADYSRNSAFEVKWDSFICANIYDSTGNLDRRIDKSKIRITFSDEKERTFTYDAGDWKGQNDVATWMENVSEGAVNVRFEIIYDENDDTTYLRAGETLKIEFYGIIPEVVSNAGENNIAWNNFAYGYMPIDSEGVELSLYNIAEPAKVGVWVKEQTTTISGTKTWSDHNNKENTRPQTVTINLLANGEKVKETVISADNEWKYTFENIPIRDKNGDIIEYSVTEVPIANYESQVYGFNIVNTYSAVTSLSGEKIWNDKNNADNTRPDSIRVNLMANDVFVKSTIVTPDENNQWKYEFTGLPKYDENDELIFYTVTEDIVYVKGGSDVYTGYVDGNNIINTYIPKTEVSGTKTWNDYNNLDNTRPKSIVINLMKNGEVIDSKVVTEQDNWSYKFKDLDKYDENNNLINYTITEDPINNYEVSVSGYNITNTYTAKTNVVGTKIWDDYDNKENTRPDSIIVSLIANNEKIDERVVTAENNWNFSFLDLPKYDKDYNEINYSIIENQVKTKDGTGTYTSTITNGETDNSFVITNTYEVKKSYTIKKVWNDNDNQDGKRPTSIRVQLLANGIPQGDEITLSAGDDGIWQAQELTYTWTDLEKYDNSNNLIIYTVRENTIIEGYNASYDITSESNTTIVKNGHTPEVTSYSVQKIWEDNNNQDGKRPTKVKLQLKADGNPVGNIVVLSAGDDNVWQANELEYTWTNLPKFNNGELIKYTVEEQSVENGYATTYAEENGRTIVTNTRAPEKTAYYVEKVWNDNENQDGKRPTSVQIQLKANGNPVGNIVTLSAGEDGVWQADELKYTWTNLPKYENGQLIVYEVQESAVENGYEPAYNTETEGKTIITNSYTPEKTRYIVEKVWNDNDNQDGKRPTSVQIQLKVNGNSVGNVVTLSAGEDGIWQANELEYTWTDLPKYENGLLITYEVEESVVENGYEAAYNTQIEGKTIITNSYTPEKTRYTVEKIWNDSENQDGKRPESIQVQLQVDGEEFVYDGIVATQVLDESNSWTYTWENLPERLSGQIVEYKAVEIFIDNYYETSYDYITKNKTTVISNKHIPETTEHSVKKVWNDMDNQDGKRPTSIRVQLKADGNDYGEVITLTAGDDNIWQADELRYTWTNLPKYNNGREVKYVVEEQTPGNNYVITYATEPNKTTITNTRTPENITYEVQKVWDDADNQDGKRPTSIKVQLKADENDYGEAVTLTAGDDNIWQADELRYTWSNLPKYSNGIEIKYKVEEQDVGNGYVATYVEEDKKTIVTNTRLPEKTTYNVEKVWRDENNQDGIRSNSIEVQLIANKKVNGQIIRANIGEAVNLSEGNNWNYQWTNLEKNSEGTLIEYSVAEITTIDGYNTDYKNENDKTTITNIHVPEETSYSIEKVWDDLDNQDGKRPTSIKIQLKADGHNYGDIVTLTAGIDGIWQTNELTYTWSKLPKYNKGIEVKYSAEEVAIGNGYTEKYKTSKGKTTITNSYTPGKVNYSVEKVWIDSNNQDAKRPTEIEVELKANGAALVYGDIVTRQILNSSNGWSYTWEELPERLNGIVVNYTVVELSKIDEYPTAQYEYEDSKTIITNERETDKTKYSVKKLWDDNKNQDGIRPSSINVQLKADGEICGSEITLSDANNWSYTWNNLEKNKAGKEIVYTVTEVQKINGYETSKVDNNGETIITNRHTPETTKYSIRKVWKDANDQDGERPTSIKIQLMANGNTYGDVITLTAGEDGKWQDNELQYTWNELPKYKDGNIIKYSANELEVKDGYSVTYNTDKPDETIITNSYTPGEVTYSVEKVWEDSNNQDGIRPSNIEVKLIAKVEGNIITLNGVDIIQTLNEGNSWKFTWEKLPLKSAGKYIEYSVIENTQIADYGKPKYSYANGKTTIINKHEIKKVSKSVVKVWEDNFNQDGIRPESIKVQLKANGDVLGTPITLNQTNNWKYTWNNLDENRDGKTIQYTIEEIGIADGYESSSETDENITKITNTHSPEQTEHSIEKVWNDSNNKDNVRPTQIKVQLKANGTNVGDAITLSAGSDNEWQDNELQYTWKNLPKYSNGIEIKYTVEEQDVDKKYVSSVTNITNKTIITNTHIIDTIEITGKKIWVDEDNKYSKRPGSVVINLVRNGQVIKTFELRQDSNWEYKFVKLPKYDDNGNEYIYTISELPVDGYSSEVSGFNIINKYIPPVEVEKPEMIIGVKTGDNIALSINAIRLAIAVLIITFIIYKNERRDTQK